MFRMLLMILLGLLITGCAATPHVQRMPPRPAMINHIVFTKLHNPADADELIADCDAKLATIPGVVSYYAGKHFDTGRATVEGNYDVGVYLGFESQEDLTRYVEHPNHVAIVEKWRLRWEWIRVHDVIDETP